MQLRVLLLAAVGTLLVGSSALAGGGTSIADAPQLPTWGDVVSGTTNIEAAHVCGVAGDATEFYRVSLKARDVLTVSWWPTLPDEDVSVGLLPPSVTDDTLDQANCVLPQWTATDSFGFRAPYAGSWIVAIRAATTLGYGLEARLHKYTHATLTGPRVATRRSLVTLRGVIHGFTNARGVSTNGVARMLIWTHSKWKTLGGVLLGPSGKFEYFWRPRRVGVARVRIMYSGGYQYLPTWATRSIRVTAG